MDEVALLKHIEDAYLRNVQMKPNLQVAGPFVLSLSPATSLRWMNNALVNDDSRPITDGDVRKMVQEFQAYDRMPRMELIREIRKPLIELLLKEGFEIECELPIMICTEETFLPQTNPAIGLEFVTQASDPVPFMRVADQAFEHDEPITPERIESMRQSLRRGTSWAALARIDGQPAAVATLVVSDSVAELAGVGTLPEFRRRGAALTVSTFLLEEFFKHGEIVWLSAGDETAQAVYERLGFRLLGTQVNISKPS